MPDYYSEAHALLYHVRRVASESVALGSPSDAGARLMAQVSDTARRTFRQADLETLVQGMALEMLTGALAQVLWLLRGGPTAPDAAGQDADYSNAAHELRCLYAEHILQLIGDHEGCPGEFVCDKDGRPSRVRFEYLSAVTVHDLVVRRAHEGWRARGAASDIRGAPTDAKDYFHALNDLRDYVIRAVVNKRWSCSHRCTKLLAEVQETFGPVLPALDLWSNVTGTSIAALLLRLCEARLQEKWREESAFTQFAALRVRSPGGIFVRDARDFLATFEAAYDGLASLELKLHSPPGEVWAQADAHPPNSREEYSTVPASSQLVLTAVELHSPGFWEFLGKLNPLEVLREYLKDRHERKKDLKYRNDAEAKRLELENDRLALEVVERRLALADKLHASRRDLAPLLKPLVVDPLRGLARIQDVGLIEGVEISSSKKEPL